MSSGRVSTGTVIEASGAIEAGSVVEVVGLGFRYRNAEHMAVKDVDLRVEAGALHAIVGPNGSGKSTLLRLVTGALRPAEGSVKLWGEPVAAWSPRDLAQKLAVVTQREAPAFPVSVRDLVASGRYAHLGAFRSERAEDRTIIESALERCGIPHLADRSVRELSGGEFQRARIARALAQEPAVLVLDEPTAALDIRYQMAILELLCELREARGLTVVLVTHRIALAGRFADRLSLMDEGRIAREGVPSDVLEAATLSRIYGWPLSVIDIALAGVGKVPQIVPLPGPQPSA